MTPRTLAPILTAIALLAPTLAGTATGTARAASMVGVSHNATTANAPHSATTTQNASVIVDTGTSLGVIPPTAFGINDAAWDSNLFDANVPGLIKQAGLKVMRFPGGSTADYYHWQTNSVTPLSSTLVGGVDPNGTFDHFMQVVQQSDAQAMITVDYGSNATGTAGGDPNEAANWVYYANKIKGYGVKYWEIGNEIYGNGTYGAPWEVDLHPHATGGGPVYAKNARRFIHLMKKADPTIKIGVVLTAPGNWPDGVIPAGQTMDWNDAVLSRIGKKIDFVVVHWYPQDPPNESDANLLQSAPQGISGRTPSIPAMVATLRSEIDKWCGSHAKDVQIMVTETNSVSYNPGKQTVSLVNALFAADNYMTWLENGAANVDWWDLHNGIVTGTNISPTLYGSANYGDYGVLSRGQSANGASEPPAETPFPAYYGLQMLSKLGAAGDQMVAASSDQPLITAHAVKQANGSLAVLLIDKSLDTSYDVTLTAHGYTPAATRTVYTYGENSSAITATQQPAGGAITIAPYSLTTVVMTPGTPGGPTATPELGSGELLATGLAPVLFLVFRRKRRKG